MTTTNEIKEKINELLHKSSEPQPSNINQRIKFAEQALQLSKQIDYPKGMADSLFYMGRAKYGLSAFKPALSLLSEALDLYQSINHQRGEAKCLLRIGAIHLCQFNYDKALHYLQNSYDIFESLDDKIGKNKALGNIAVVYDNKEYYDLALKHFFKVLKTAEELEDKRTEGLTLINIGNIYSHQHKDEESLDCFIQALHLFENIGDINLQCTAFLNIGSICIHLDQLDRALENLEKNRELRKKIGLSADEYCLMNIGRAYGKKKDYDQALKYFRKSLKLSREHNDIKRQALIHLFIGEIFLSQHQYNDAISHFEKVEELFDGINRDKILENSYKNLSIVYEKQNNYHKALLYHKKFYTLHEKSFNMEMEKRIGQLHVQFEVERKEKENEMYRLKIDEQQKRLAILAKNLSEKNELVRQLNKKIAELDENHTTEKQKQTITSILAHLKETTQEQDSWLIFQKEFNKLYPNFIDQISKEYSTLTKQELKVCALLKIELSTKEIAKILFIAPRSVEMYRYRIRKKINLDHSEKLNNFILDYH